MWRERMKYIMLLVMVIGFTILIGASFFQHNMNDFTRGFATGIASVFVVVGFIYTLCDMIRKRKELIKKIEDNTKD